MKILPVSICRTFFCFLVSSIFLFLTSCRPTTPKHSETVPPLNHAHPAPKPRELSATVSMLTNKPSSPDTSDTSDPIGDVLSADLTPGETTTRLLSLLPSTPAADKSFIIQIAGNYCSDEEYWRLLPLLLDRSQPEDVRDELMRDVLRRPDPIRLRPLYRLALDNSHPLSSEAREYLFAYLQDVPQDDFAALSKAVQKFERENR